MEEEFQFCGNCKRDISTRNYIIHTVHCERKILLCDQCSEPVPYSELEKHEEEYHSKVMCSDCRFTVERWRMEKHKETCVKKLVACQYCELEVPLDNLSEHNTACGCRTEQCSKCNKYVMIKDLEKHLINCLKMTHLEKDFEICHSCNCKIPKERYHKHILLCFNGKTECHFCGKEISKKNDYLHFQNCLKILKMVEEDNTSQYQNDGHAAVFQFIPVPSEKLERMRLHEKDFEICHSCNCKIPEERYHKHIHLCFNANTECHFCGIEISKKNENSHFQNCFKILKMVGEDNTSQYKHKRQADSVPKPSENSGRMRYLEENVEMCPSCNCKIPEERYHEHLLLCYNEMIQCHFCGMEILKKKEYFHFQQCYKILEMVVED